MNYPAKVPFALLPHLHNDPTIRGPAWLTPPPWIRRLRHGGAITLSLVSWLDCNNARWDTPPGFYFDGMSYPFLTRLIFRWDKWARDTLRTAANHDKNYTLFDFYGKLWPCSQVKADRDLLAGLKLEQPQGDHLKYIGVRIGGYSVWTKDGRHPLVAEWLNYVDDPVELRAWIETVIERDAAA